MSIFPPISPGKPHPALASMSDIYYFRYLI